MQETEADITTFVRTCLRPDCARTTAEIAELSGLTPSKASHLLHRMLAKNQVRIQRVNLFSVEKWALTNGADLD
jgi:predicted Fe-S protein YdhL (DUF1289 family)